MSEVEKAAKLEVTPQREVELDLEAKQGMHGLRPDPARRSVLKLSALALATAGTYGVAPFVGPWKHNHVWSQAAQKKPLARPLGSETRQRRREG